MFEQLFIEMLLDPTQQLRMEDRAIYREWQDYQKRANDYHIDLEVMTTFEEFKTYYTWHCAQMARLCNTIDKLYDKREAGRQTDYRDDEKISRILDEMQFMEITLAL